VKIQENRKREKKTEIRLYLCRSLLKAEEDKNEKNFKSSLFDAFSYVLKFSEMPLREKREENPC